LKDRKKLKTRFTGRRMEAPEFLIPMVDFALLRKLSCAKLRLWHYLHRVCYLWKSNCSTMFWSL